MDMYPIRGRYEVGKEYLVFALTGVSKDVILRDPYFFWYGWTDILPAGTNMIFPAGNCEFSGGNILLMQKELRELGPGHKIK